VYGEGVFIEFQNFLIILLIWNYNKSIFMLEKMFFMVFAFAYAFLLLDGTFMTTDMWNIIASSGIVLLVLQRGPQIFTTWRNKSTGQLAFVTSFLQWAGVIARTATVLFESDDFMYRLQFMSALVFNSIMMLQFVLYWNSAPKKKAKISGPGANKAKANKTNKLD